MKRLFVLLMLAVAACSPYRYQAVNQNLELDVSKEGFARHMRVVDDSLEASAEITSLYGYRVFAKNGVVYDDNFLRAYVHKKTGETVYQVYDRVYMKDWYYLYRVNYRSGDEVKTQKLQRISSDVERCSSVPELGCRLREDVAWLASRELLNEIAESYVTDDKRKAWEYRKTWEYRLKAKQGPDVNRTFYAAEVAAFIEAVDKYKQEKGLQ